MQPLIGWRSVRRMGRRRYVDYDRTILLRAAKLARLPGVRRAEACKRFDLSIGMLRRAMKELALESIPSRRDLVLHAITGAGSERSGELPDLARVANYVDYVNKDASKEADVRKVLEELVRAGTLAVMGTRWRLLTDFP